MKGLVLAGGFATRLRPLSCSKPKLLFPVVGVPLIDRMVEWLTVNDVPDVILAVNHLSDKLRMEVFGRKLQDRVILSVEDSPLGTGGPIRQAAPMLGGKDPVVVVNGDVVSDIDLRGMVAEHFRTGADATIAIVSVADPRQFGSATTDSENRIVGFIEKADRVVNPSWVNAGVYILNPTVVEMIPRGKPASLEREIFPVLAKRGVLGGWKHHGFWYDIGKIREYVIANRNLLELASSKRKPAKLDSNVRIEEPLYVGQDCEIEADSRIGPYTIVSQKVRVGSRSIVRNTIIFEETSIGNDCIIEDSLIGEAVRIGHGVRVGEGSIIAGEVVLPDNTSIKPGSTVLN